MAFAPNSELVAMTYLRRILDPSVSVGTTLPEDKTSWANGFVQVQVVGGAPDIDVPTRNPLIQVDVWMPTITGSKPKWGQANTIAENIVTAIYEYENSQMLLDLGNYQDALVQVAYIALEPRRITNDPAGHARYSFDISLQWITSENLVA